MRILVDADACPVKHIIAQHASVPVLWFSTRDHNLSGFERRGGAAPHRWIVIDKGPDAVDHAVVSQTARGDIVVTQDYGLASLVLAKGAHALSPTGLVFTAWNIDRLLADRFYSAKARRGGIRTKGPAKRTKADDERFAEALRSLL